MNRKDMQTFQFPNDLHLRLIIIISKKKNGSLQLNDMDALIMSASFVNTMLAPN